jgi:DNA invertase Pin-like site-specific DNA recombinase
MNKKPRRVALYVRVSTDGQTVENQRRELDAVAERNGWHVVKSLADEGMSGAKGRDRRPGFDALWKGIARREFDVVAASSVDRLGRSLQDLIGLLGEMKAKGVDLYLHQQGSTRRRRQVKPCSRCWASSRSSSAGLARAREQGSALDVPW